VLDPTLLLEKSDYSALIDDSDSKSAKTEKVFCYVLDETSEKEQFIRNFSAEYENDYRIFSPKFDQKYEPVEVWLKGFRDSEFVITDSFHGTVFAIINRKDFLVFNNPMRGSARFESLLDSLGISKDRLIDEKSPVADLGSLRAINWTDVDKKLTTLRRDSKKWLIDSLV
jgi:exopolysaccharide biosynthesis predicted pyruvyltransferase EpsI